MSPMSSPAEMTPRERNDAMLARIRGGPPQPYQEGAYVLRVLTVPGRRTGQPRSWPIAVVQWHQTRYLCAPNRRRDWVRNLQAGGWCTLGDEPPARYDATLTEAPEAAEVVATYLGVLNQRRSPSNQWPFPGDAPAERIRAHLAEIAVFQLTPSR